MADVTKYKAEKLVPKEVDVYQLELSAAEFTTLRSYLGGSSYTDITNVIGLDREDDKRITEIYSSMINI